MLTQGPVESGATLAPGTPVHLPEPHSISDVHWLRRPGCFATSSYSRLRMHDIAVAEPVRELNWQGSMISLAKGGVSVWTLQNG